MISLRGLSVFYLAAASSFAVAVVLADHPAWKAVAHKQGAAATVALNDYVVKPGWTLTKASSVALFNFTAEKFGMLEEHLAQKEVKKPVAVAQRAAPKKPQRVIVLPNVVASVQPEKEIAPPPAKFATPDLRPPILESKPQAQPNATVASAPHYTLAPQAEKPAPAIAQIAPPVATPDNHRPSQAELVLITQHFRTSLTKEMLANFELFLFVSKADHGSAAQRMYVFQKQNSGDLVMLYDWPVSTGRELDEIAPNGQHEPTITPAGYYELDPHRMYVSHFSGQWKQPMPYAMFFNWEKNGFQTGLAIHGASGKDIGLLGERASAGCIHLAPENARVLFTLIRNDYKGLMPKFAYDKRTATMSNQGVLVHTADGRLEMAEGYKVLVFIENYGGENVVAALF
ncbi:MAG TPA: L,D-transpeptidase family protein [Rhizomicrobium sp.]|nr:L,D-transpeptidase family protein [Rhizomicrobium sp.]